MPCRTATTQAWSDARPPIQPPVYNARVYLPHQTYETASHANEPIAAATQATTLTTNRSYLRSRSLSGFGQLAHSKHHGNLIRSAAQPAAINVIVMRRNDNDDGLYIFARFSGFHCARSWRSCCLAAVAVTTRNKRMVKKRTASVARWMQSEAKLAFFVRACCRSSSRTNPSVSRVAQTGSQ